jgi:hypothetical protein
LRFLMRKSCRVNEGEREQDNAGKQQADHGQVRRRNVAFSMMYCAQTLNCPIKRRRSERSASLYVWNPCSPLLCCRLIPVNSIAWLCAT